jgi:hypothetical protein
MWTPQFQCCIHIGPLRYHFLNHLNPIGTFPPCSSKIHLKSILSSVLLYVKRSLLLRCSLENFVCISHSPICATFLAHVKYIKKLFTRISITLKNIVEKLVYATYQNTVPSSEPYFRVTCFCLSAIYTMVYQKLSRLAAWSEN